MKLFMKGLLLIAVPSLVELALVGMLWKTQAQTAEAMEWAKHTKQALYQASMLVDPLLREAARVRASAIVGNPPPIDRHAVWVDLDGRLTRLEKLVDESPIQIERVQRMREAANDYHAQTERVYAALDSGQPVLPVQLTAMEDMPLPPQILEFRAELDALVADELRVDAMRSAQLAATRALQRHALVAAIVGSMLIWGIAALAFVTNVGRRFGTLTENAERLGRLQPLGTPLAGNDELAELDTALHRTSRRLTEADHEQVVLQASLQARAQELTQVNESLRQQKQDNDMFIYSVSHDLRSPLVNLQGFSRELQVSCDELRDMIETMTLPESERKGIERVIDGNLSEALHFLRTAVTRSAAIIDALLRISRAGRLEYEWQRVSVARTVARVIESLHQVISEQGIVVSVDELPPAWGDPTSIEQIFSNLIDNAVNYLDPARAGRIDIGSLEDDATFRGESDEARPKMRTYYVRDNGLGIPAAYMPKMFRAFQRLHGDRAKGEGIGLALVRRVAERHGGHAWVESEEGVGSTFFVRLPAQPLRVT